MKSEDFLEHLAVKIYARRYKGRIAGIRKAFEDYQKHMRVQVPLPLSPSRWVIVGAMLIGGGLGVFITIGFM